MKVYQITEAPRVEPFVPKTLPTSVDIKPGVIGTDLKNKMWNVVDQDGKVLQRFTGASAEADANTARDKIQKQIKANVPPANTKDDTGSEKKKAKSTFDKIKKSGPQIKSWMKRHLSRIFGSSVAGIVIKSFEISGIVSLYNSYFDEIYSLIESKAANANDDVIMGHSMELKRIRAELVKNTTDLMIGSIGMAFGSTSVLVSIAVVSAAASFFTAGALLPASAMVNIFVGAVAAWGAYEGTLKVCQMKSAGAILGLDVSIYDYTQNKLSTTWLTPEHLRQIMVDNKASQSFAKYVAAIHTNPLTVQGSPYAISGYNFGPALSTPIKAVANTVKGIVDHKDQNELNRVVELSGVIQEKQSEIKIDSLPDELKKLAMLGAKTVKKTSKENKST